MMGMGEKPRNTNKEKNPPFGYPQIPPSSKWRLTVFRCLKTPKTSRTYPKWVGVPNLMGQKKERIGCGNGQLKADNMIFIPMKFQDL